MREQMKRMLKRIATLLLAVILFASPAGLASVRAADRPSADKFEDTDPSAWYYGAVEYVADRGLMNGVDNSRFDPDGGLTRAMAAQVLYNLGGNPSAVGAAPFSDVESGSWYENGVAWAAEAGIVYGFPDGTFRPGEFITRQDLMTVIYRYSMKFDSIQAEPAPLDSFADGAGVADYAREAVEWAVGAGIVKGSGSADGTVSILPDSTALRAQLAEILFRFCESMENIWNVSFTGNAAVTVNGVQTKGVQVEDGETVTFTVRPEPGYSVSGVTANGAALSAVDGVYSLTPHADTQVVIETKQNAPVYTVTFQNTDLIQAEVNGKIADTVTVTEGCVIEFKVNVAEGAELSAVVAGDDVVLKPDGRGVYSFTVYGNTTVSFLTAAVYTVTFEGEHAAAYVDGEPVSSISAGVWETVSFTVVPEGGYELAAVAADDKILTAENGVYSLTVKGNTAVTMAAVESAAGAAADYTITLTGEHLEFYQDGRKPANNQIVLKKGESYVTVNAIGQDGYYATGGTCTDANAKVQVVANLVIISGVTENCTVTVDSSDQYTVTFAYSTTPDNTGAYTLDSNSQTVTYGELVPNPGTPKKGGTEHRTKHLEWFYDAAYTQPVDFEKDTVTKNMTIYGDWKNRKFTVTFDTGEGSKIPSQSVETGSKAKSPEVDPVREGYVFAGWYKEQRYKNPFNFNTETIRKETTIYAKWMAESEVKETELTEVFLDETTGQDSRYGFNVGCAVKTWKRAFDLISESDAPDKKIIISGLVTIEADPSHPEGVTWGSDDPGKPVKVQFVYQASGAVQVQGKLTLKNIEFTATDDTKDKSGCPFYVYEGGTLILDSGAKIGGYSTTSSFIGVARVEGGTFIMENGSSIHDIKMQASQSNGAIHVMANSNKNRAIFTMNGGTIENISFEPKKASSAEEKTTAVFVESVKGNATVNFNGGTITGCGKKSGDAPDDSLYVVQNVGGPPGPVPGVINFNGTKIENCSAKNGLVYVKTGSGISTNLISGTLDAGDGAALWVEKGSAVTLSEKAQNLTVNGTIFLNNDASNDAVIELKGSLTKMGGNHKIDLAAPHPGAKIVKAGSGYSITEEDVSSIQLEDSYQDSYLLEKEGGDGSDKEIAMERTADQRPKAVVYLSGAGDDGNDGSTPALAVQTFDRAKTLLQEKAKSASGEGTLDIAVCGTVYISGQDVTMSLDGIEGARVVRADGFADVMFEIGSKTAEQPTDVTLEEIVVDGQGDYVAEAPDVIFSVDSGTLTMKNGAAVQNHGNEKFYENIGGAIRVGIVAPNDTNPPEATLIMEEGSKITDCYARTSGAGVLLSNFHSKFEMKGGEISKCHLMESLASRTNQILGIAVSDNSKGATIKLNGGKIIDSDIVNEAAKSALAEKKIAEPFVTFGNGGTTPKTETDESLMTVSKDFEIGGTIFLLSNHFLTLNDDFFQREKPVEIHVANNNITANPKANVTVPVAKPAEGATLSQNILQKLTCKNDGYEFSLGDDGVIIIKKTA